MNTTQSLAPSSALARTKRRPATAPISKPAAGPVPAATSKAPARPAPKAAPSPILADLSKTADGVKHLNPIKIAGGLTGAAGGGAGWLTTKAGNQVEKAGDEIISRFKGLWNSGGVMGRVGGALGMGLGAAIKGAGWTLGKVGQGVSYVAHKAAESLAFAGDTIWGFGKSFVDSAKAAGGMVKDAAKAVGSAIKKIFSGW